MARVSSVKDQSVEDYLTSFVGDNLSYRTVFDLLGRLIPFGEGVIVTSLPRAGLQIVQPLKVSPSMIKAYTQTVHTEDRPTWRAILADAPVRESDCWSDGDFEQSPYFTQMLQPLGLRNVLTVPLRDPVINGYPGALVLFRRDDQGAFTADEGSQLLAVARQLDRALLTVRAERQVAPCDSGNAWAFRTIPHQFAVSADLKPLLSELETVNFDARIREQMLEHARTRFTAGADEANASDRIQFPDSHGVLRAFRVVLFPSYRALSDGPVMFFCAQPEYCDWSTLRATDVQADTDMARLIPALRFMQDHFHRRIKLPEVAKAVHLSTFHFHRRFTELLGITPKHFLLECQVHQTKLDLVTGAKDLVDIARASGFAHQSHFTSRFKQATGMTPTRWRRATNLRMASRKPETVVV